ncbi:MAG: hypothetical protein VKI42_01000 [Synechococcaceae cyanobacterium]|nr:hypothetical protein [Synechococcaceae cyanobacterium]
MGKQLLVAPRGELMWAKVLRPGIANKGKPDEKEQWSVDLLLAKADAEAQKFIQSLKQQFLDAHGSASRPGPNGLPWRTFLNEQGDETDIWQISFKRNVRTSRGAELAPPVVQDARGTLWPSDVLIGNGSVGKVAFDIWSWSNPEGGKGVSLNLHGVRVLHLVEYAPPDASEAFGDAEDGYVLTGNEPKVQPAGAQPAAALKEPDWGGSEEEVPF